MRRAEKFYLVSESRLRQLEHSTTKSDILSSVKQPNEQQLVKVYRRMDNVLNDPTKSDHEKTMEHGEALNEFTVLRDRIDHHKNAFKPNPVTAPLEDPMVTSTVDMMPKMLKQQAQHLMKRLRGQQDVISWTPNGEVSIRGELLPGAHISDLVGDILRQRKAAVPGRERFLRALASINTPEDLVRNKSALEQYRRIKQRSRPPGIPGISVDGTDEEEVFGTPPTSKKRKILKRLRSAPAKKIRWTKF